MDFKVGDTVWWPNHLIDDSYQLVGGSGVVFQYNPKDDDGRNYAVLEDGSGDEVWPLNEQMTKVGIEESEPRKVPTKSLSGDDIGKKVRIPMTTGLVIEGTLKKVSHFKDVEITVGFDESDRTWNADLEGDSEYVNV